jgi:hypothetical protein
MRLRVHPGWQLVIGAEFLFDLRSSRKVNILTLASNLWGIP